MLAVGALAVALRGLHELAARDPAVLEGDLLHDRDRRPRRKHKLPERKALSEFNASSAILSPNLA